MLNFIKLAYVHSVYFIILYDVQWAYQLVLCNAKLTHRTLKYQKAR